ARRFSPGTGYTLMQRRSWLRSALLESFLLFRSILRPASKGPEAHEGEGEDRTPGHSQQFGGIAPQRYIGNQGLQHLPSEPHQAITIQDVDRQDDGKAYHLPPDRTLH